MTNEFKTICDNQSDEFKALVNQLLPKKVDKNQAYRLLSFVDSVVSYYLLKNERSPIFPIIYIPNAPDWAEVICLKYLMLKMQFSGDMRHSNQFYGKPVYDTTGKSLNIDEQKRLNKEWRKMYTYGNNAFKAFAKDNQTDTYNLFVTGQNNLNGIKRDSQLGIIFDIEITESKIDNQLKKIFGDDVKNNTGFSVENIVVTEKTLGKDRYKSIDNIFCFYTRNGNCETFNKNNLINWTNLKTCFIFEFSSHPYCLNNILKTAKSLCFTFCNEELFHRGILDYEHFITLTEEESDYIFDRKAKYQRHIFPLVIDDPTELESVRELFREISEVRMSRNLLQLCLNDDLKNKYFDYLKSKDNSIISDDWYSPILNMIIQHIQSNTKRIIEEIQKFVGQEPFAFVVANSTPQPIKNILKKLLADNNLKAKIYKYTDLKKQPQKYKNKIKESKVVVLRFLSHYVNTQFTPKYPNSFDSPFLNENQTLIEFIDEAAIIDYEKYKYDYDRLLNNLLGSEFRTTILNDNGKKLTAPQFGYLSSFDDYDDDDEEKKGVAIPMIKFEFEDETKSFPESELVIYRLKDKENLYIDTLREIKDNLSSLASIQSVADVADVALDIFFKQQENQNNLEAQLRSNYVNQGIIPEEDRTTNIPIWKFALKKKIIEKCIDSHLISSDEYVVKDNIWELLKDKTDSKEFDEIYQEIGVKHCQKERMLKEWCDTKKEEPVAPGFRKDQKALFIDYLGMQKGMLNFFRFQQIKARNDTRKQNSITEGFLEEVLFNEITDEVASALLGDEQLCEYLAIEEKDDIVALKSIAEENINLKTIKNYTL